MLKKLLLILIITGFAISASAQKAFIKGAVVDTAGKRKLQYSSVMLVRDADSILVKSVRADEKGNFELNNLQKGKYNLIISYPKMADYVNTFNLTDSSKINLGEINMELQSLVLQEVTIMAKKEAIRVKGDTITYQADSFKVAEGANVQELLKRLPGFEVSSDGTIKAQGKEVANVLVDGDEFFGDDPLLATKYLKADAVKEVEVYDKKSKTAELTGIDDGKKEKTVNIKLKDNAKNGYLANLDANTNSSNFNDYGGMAGIFKDKLKAAVYGTASNIGLQSKVNQAMNSMKGSDYEVIEMSDDGSSIMMIGGMGDSDDYYNPNNGLPDNRTLGAHFSNKWNENKTSLKLNYKFLDRGLSNFTTNNGQQLLPDQTLFINSAQAANNSNKRGNDVKGNVEFALDSLSKLKVSFGLNNNTSEIRRTSFSETHTSTGRNVNENDQSQFGDGSAETYNGNINYTRKFAKKGRTFSMDLQPEYKSNTENLTDLNVTQYYDNTGALDRTENLNLLKVNSGKQTSIASKISYSEPLSKQITFLASYSFKQMNAESYRSSFDRNTMLGGNPKLVDSLSNNFKFNSLSNVGKGVIQWRIKNLGINAGLEATHTNFDLNDLDRVTRFSRNYLNLAPNSNINLKVSRNANVSVNYNGRTTQPSLNQLQPIREINTPLYQVVGNANLRPSFTNSVSMNYNAFISKSEQYVYAYLDYSAINNDITTTEQVDQNNKRTVSYLNVNGNKTLSGALYYDKGFSKLHLSISGEANFNRSERVVFVNNQLNNTLTTGYRLGFGARYYIEKFNISYSSSVNVVQGTSSIGSVFDGNTIDHAHRFSTSLQLPYNMTFSTDAEMTFRPANAAFPTPLNVAIWNASFAVKAMKSKSLQIKLSVNDILKQRIGFNRYAGGSTVSESTFSYIPRYILLGVNYNLSGNFTSAGKK